MKYSLSASKFFCHSNFLQTRFLSVVEFTANDLHHEAEIPTIHQSKKLRKKLTDEIKNLYKCNFNRTNSRKGNKTIENFKEKYTSLHCPLLREGCGGSSLKLSYHTLRPSIPLSVCMGEVPSNFTQDPQCNIDSSLVVLSRPTVFFFLFALASNTCLEVCPEAFYLHGQTI